MPRTPLPDTDTPALAVPETAASRSPIPSRRRRRPPTPRTGGFDPAAVPAGIAVWAEATRYADPADDTGWCLSAGYQLRLRGVVARVSKVGG